VSSPRAVRVLAAAVLAVVGLVLAGCGAGGDPRGAPTASGTVRVGSADSGESRLLAEIYATALSIKGVKVERQFGLGGRASSLAGLRDGSIDLVPAYTGHLLSDLDPQATATAPAEVYALLQQNLPPSLRVLQPSAAEDRDAVVVTRAFATGNSLRSLDDLARLCPTVTFGGPPEFRTRPDGVPGLQRDYGCTFREFRPLDAGGPLTVAALRDGTVQAGELSTTDPSIPANDFVVLADPRSTFAAQQVVPLVDAAELAEPAVADTLNRISSKLDTATLTDLDRRLDGPDGPDPAQVARDWLSSAGIG
jgi:osmoprotectant transport system substrate-binding protein